MASALTYIGDRVFETSLYRSWVLELRSHAYDGLVQQIDREPLQRTHFGSLILQLRKDLESRSPHAIQTACWLYQQKLSPFIASLFFPESQFYTSCDDLRHLWIAISKSSGSKGAMTSLEQASQDSLFMGNLPFSLWEENLRAVKTHFIRTPNPFYAAAFSASGQEVKFIPEFDALLNSLKEGETCFYVNTMTRDLANPCEYTLSASLHDLETEYKALYPFTVDRDSKEYFVSSPCLFADTHIKNYLNRLFSSDSLFQWPAKYDRELGVKQIKSTLHFVHKKFFDNKDLLSADERIFFNELTIVYLILQMIEVIQPTICNISCLVTVDRGPSLFTLLYVLMRHRANEAAGEDFYKNVATFLLGPSAVFCDRPIRRERFDIFLACMKHILKSPFEMPSNGDVGVETSSKPF